MEDERSIFRSDVCWQRILKYKKRGLPAKIESGHERRDMTNLFESLAEILEVDEIDPSRPLRDYETWDSLAALSVVATVKANFGVSITSAELRDLKTAADLRRLVEARQTHKTREKVYGSRS
jgi:acyl carrier protein